MMWLKKFSLGLFLSLFYTAALSQSPQQLISDSETNHLYEKVKILHEEDQELSIDQVRKRLADFDWHTSGNPNYGLAENGLWLHSSFSRVNDIHEWVIDISFSHLERVDFYLLQGKQVIASSEQGKLSGHQTFRYPTLKVQLPLAQKVDLLVRIESKGTQLIAPLDIQPYAKYMRMMFWDNLLWGLFYGGLLILAIYTIVLYIGSREISLLAYVGYICAAIVWQFVWGGHSIMLLPFAVTEWLSAHMDIIFVLIAIASGVFTYTFLEVDKTAPKTSPFIKTNIALLALMGFCSLLNLFPVLWQNALVYLVSLFAITSYLAAGFESYINKFRPARYFIFAWTILALTAVIGMLSLTGALPSNNFTTYCFQVGVFLEAGLFSLAIMDKSHNQLEQDIQQATNDLRNNMEFIEEQNARLDIARKDAINASNIKSQFLANMSHEIRTPLNAILGFSKELNNMPLPVDKQEHVRIINSAADSLLSIVNDVLDVSKIEAGKLELNSQPFSPNDTLEEMVSVMSKSAHLKNLEFLFELAPLPEKLIGDSQRIKQILTNLLGNALKFTPSGYISLKASGRFLPNDLYELTFVVKDSGIGISQQDRNKLFNAFSQIDDATSRSYQGTGLGLVICQQLVKLMAGKVSLSSDPGKGSCFTVTITTSVLNKNEYQARSIGWDQRQVLVLNSDAESTQNTVSLLQNAGAQVNLAETVGDLSRLKHKFSSVFVCLPQRFLEKHGSIMQQIFQLDFTDLVVLYSGQDPLSPEQLNHADNIRQLRLPLTYSKLASLNQMPTQTKHDQLQNELLNLPRAEILAVDDMEMNLRLLKTWLKPSNLKLTLAYNGEDAVNLCQQQEFDIILMDVQMPNMDGLQASRLIRQTELNIGTPIIAVTAHALKEEQDRLLASGMDDYLPKPIDLSDLIVLIQRWCDHGDHQEHDLPSVDWSLALKTANQNANAAKEVLSAFVEQLPELMEQIDQAWKRADKTQVQHLVHKLHGACCYTGVPILRDLCEELESAFKREQYDLVEQKMPTFLAEANSVMAQSIAFTA